MRTYLSLENSGNSFNVKFLADNMDLSTGGDAATWSAKYKMRLPPMPLLTGGGLTSGNLAPGLFGALSYVNNGRVKRVGSLPRINKGLGYLENSYTRASGVNFNAAVADRNAAALANRNLLIKANLAAARPERINSFEAGYKSVWLDDRLTLDIDAYTNTYDGFLGQVQVDVPHGQVLGTDAAVIFRVLQPIFRSVTGRFLKI